MLHTVLSLKSTLRKINKAGAVTIAKNNQKYLKGEALRMNSGH